MKTTQKSKSNRKLFGIKCVRAAAPGLKCYVLVYNLKKNSIERVDLTETAQRIDRARARFELCLSNERTIHTVRKNTQFWVPYRVHSHTLTSKKARRNVVLFLPKVRRQNQLNWLPRFFNSIHQFYIGRNTGEIREKWCFKSSQLISSHLLD